MAHRLLASLLVLALCATTAAATAVSGPSAPARTDAVAIDADTGELASPPAQPGTNVTVRVHGVPAATSGFTLHGPPGALFENQTSRSDGVVAFWDVPAGPGTYSIEGPGIPQPLEVEIAPEAACEPEAGCAERTAGWWCSSSRSEKLEEAYRWTPLIVVNSPSGGEARADRSWTETRSVFVASGWESSTVHADEIEAYDGHSRGLYQLAKWGIYHRTHDPCWGDGRTWYDAKVIDWRYKGAVYQDPIDLTGDSRHTDRDNPLRVKHDGFWTLTTDVRYKEGELVRGGPSKHTISQELVTGVRGSVSAGPYGVSFQVMDYERTDGEGKSFTYTFPDGEWNVSRLDDSPGWAFCRPAKADCG